jgi:hypothetical protein
VIEQQEKPNLRFLAIEAQMRADDAKRDAWVKSKVSSSILVAEGITLADVQRWLKEALR